MKRFALSILTMLSLVAAFSIPLSAQTDQTGVLQGSLTSPDGAPIADAVVLVAQTDGAYPKDAISDSRGRFRFGFLTPGDYTITIQAAGFLDQFVSSIRVSAGQVTPIELELTPGEFEEIVNVTASEALINATTTEIASALTAEDTEILPISRTVTDLVKFTPGASNQNLWGGSTDQANSYKFDGVSVNQPGFGGDFLLPNVDWIEEMSVKGLGAGAEYGNFQGGVVSIVTKSGGNELRGGLRFNLEDESFNSTNLDALDVGEEDDQRLEINADVSGRIIADKLFYFASVQQAELDINVVDDAASSTEVVFLDEQRSREEVKILGKLTWQPNAKNSLNFLLGVDDVETTNRGLNSFTEPAAASTQESPSVFYNAGWSRTIGSNLFMELKFSGFDGEDDRVPQNGELPAVQILGGDRDLFRNAIFDRGRDLRSDGLNLAFDHFFETGSIVHQLKYGIEATDGSWFERRTRSGGMTWRPEEGSGTFDAADPSTWGFISSDWGSDIRLDADVLNAAFYIQDYIDFNDRVRLSAGLRYGTWEGDLTPGFGGGPSFEAVSDEAFDPRLGVVADLDGEGRWIAKVHWGRYHQSLFALLFDRAAGGAVFQDLEFWDWDGPGLPDVTRSYSLAERDELFVFFGGQTTGSEVGPVLDYEQPFVDQTVLSLEHAFAANWKLGLTYVHRENENVVALLDRNLANNYTLFRNVEVIDFRSGDPVLDPSGAPLVLPEVLVGNDDILERGWAPGLSNEEVDALSFDQDLVLTNVDDAYREMDQIQLNLEGRTDRFSLGASVVYTDLQGNFFSVSGYSDPGGIGAGQFVMPNEGILADGDLGSSEWELKVRFSARLPYDLRAGLYLLHATGTPFTPSYSIDDRNHDFVAENGEFFSFRHFRRVGGEQIFLEPRGSRENDDLTILDVHLDKEISLKNGTRLVLGFDAFNLLNEDSVLSVKGSVNDQDLDDPTTLFGAVRGRQTPRTWRLYASLRW